MPEIVLWACEVSSEELGSKSILYSVFPFCPSSSKICKLEKLCSAASGVAVMPLLGQLQAATPFLLDSFRAQTSGCPS